MSSLDFMMQPVESYVIGQVFSPGREAKSPFPEKLPGLQVSGLQITVNKPYSLSGVFPL